MKVLFVMKYPLVDQYSIMQKLSGEIDAVRNLGHDVYYISFDRNYIYLDNGKERKEIIRTTIGHSKIYFHTFVFNDIYIAARKAINRKHFDLVYFRYSPLSSQGYKMLKAASENGKVIVEIPSFPPYQEKAKNWIRQLYYLYSIQWWNKSLKYIDLFTGIGDQADNYLGVPFLNIDNGIDVSKIPKRVERSVEDEKIHLLAVASMCKWHGYERIIKGLAQWKDQKAKKYVIDLVGDEGDGSLAEWKKLAGELGISDQIILHGRMTGNPLTEMYNTATIGLSSLGLYKIGYQSGSVLKLREYMARGLPFIYAHEDPHVSNDMSWCIKVPNDESPIDFNLVQNFVEKIKRQKGLSECMREYAAGNMSWERQFKKIFERINLK